MRPERISECVCVFVCRRTDVRLRSRRRTGQTSQIKNHSPSGTDPSAVGDFERRSTTTRTAVFGINLFGVSVVETKIAVYQVVIIVAAAVSAGGDNESHRVLIIHKAAIVLFYPVFSRRTEQDVPIPQILNLI